MAVMNIILLIGWEMRIGQWNLIGGEKEYNKDSGAKIFVLSNNKHGGRFKIINILHLCKYLNQVILLIYLHIDLNLGHAGHYDQTKWISGYYALVDSKK